MFLICLEIKYENVKEKGNSFYIWGELGDKTEYFLNQYLFLFFNLEDKSYIKGQISKYDKNHLLGFSMVQFHISDACVHRHTYGYKHSITVTLWTLWHSMKYYGYFLDLFSDIFSWRIFLITKNIAHL